MQERLIKYCERRYNIALDAQTLQLGTLEYYRSLDPQFAIADSGEATHAVNMKAGIELTLDPNLSNHLFGGGISAGGGSLTIIPGPGAYFRSEVGNAYIFCVSRCTEDDPPTLDQATKLDPNYNSMWEIRDQHAFKNAVGSALLEVITIDHLEPRAKQVLCSLPIRDLKLNIQFMDRPVQYVESREYQINDVGDVSRIPNYTEAMKHAVFRKTDRDVYQREYRFVYMVTHPQLGLLSVKPEPIRIPLNRFHQLISNGFQ